MPALSLQAAAGISYDNGATQWLAANYQTALSAFATDILALFPESLDGGRPIANWATIIASFATTFTDGNATSVQLSTGSEYVFKLCWLTDALKNLGQITTAKGAAVLAAFNLRFP